MKKLIAASVIGLALVTAADIVLDTSTTISTAIRKPVTTITTVTNSIAVPVGSKMVWTQFSITYAPPAFTQAVYTVSYMIQDPVTKREIMGTRKMERMTEKEVIDFAATKGVDFTQMGQGIGYLLNEYLKTKVQ